MTIKELKKELSKYEEMFGPDTEVCVKGKKRLKKSQEVWSDTSPSKDQVVLAIYTE